MSPRDGWGSGVTSDLERLANLRRRGLLTEDELAEAGRRLFAS